MKLAIGAPAPWFTVRSSVSEEFAFHTMAGRYVVLTFIGSAGDAATQVMLQQIAARKDLFNDDHASVFAVSIDRADEAEARIPFRGFGCRIFWDHDLAVSRLFETAQPRDAQGRVLYQRASFVLDPSLRVVAVLPYADPAAHAAELLSLVGRLPDFDLENPPFAPVLIVPRIFERKFCRELIELHRSNGGRDSGYMKTDRATGKTIGRIDHSHKRRRDYVVEDEAVRGIMRDRISHCLVPEIKKAFDFAATRIERYWVCCYSAEEKGHFNPHRDNLTKGTAHRRFAVSINLNAEEFEGGDLLFPEFGPRTYRPPTGGAVVFSCSLLHQVKTVTAGRRYCVVPFLYDDAAAKIREANLQYVERDPTLSGFGPREQAAQGSPSAAA